MKRKQLKVWAASLVIGVIRPRNLMLFGVVRPYFAGPIDSSKPTDFADYAVRRAPVARGRFAPFPQELRAMIHIAG